MQSNLICLLIFVLILLQVSFSQQKETSISFQLGQVYQQDIPIIFKSYQQSTLQSFKNVERNYTLPLQICQIRVKQQGNLTQKVKLNYSSNKSDYNGNKVIYRLKDLQQSKIVIDSIVLNQLVVALFPPNQIIIYSIVNQKGTLQKDSEFKITTVTTDQLLQALFIEVNNTILLVSSQKIRKMQENGNWSTIKGYNQSKSVISSLQFLDKKLYVGLGQQGLSIYQFDSTLTTTTNVLKTQFFYMQNNQSVSFDVDQFQIFPTSVQVFPSSKYLYVLDYVQGLIEIGLDKIQPQKTITSKPRFLASSCRNLIIVWKSIYLTCPQIIEISRQNYAVTMMKETNFLSQKVKIQKDRLYLFGAQDFAVYDIYGKSLAEYKLPYQSQLSNLVMGNLITFGRQSVVLHSIAPQAQQLYCFSNDSRKVGEYSGHIQTGGICKQYFGSAETTKNAWEIYCLVDYPIRVNLKNSAQINLKIELIIGGIIISLCIIFGLYLAVKHFMAHRNYGKLTQQQFKQLKEVGSQIIPKQNKQLKEVVSDPGQ